MTQREQIDNRVRCVECTAEASPEAVGWRALLTVGDEDAEDVEEVAVYCPECTAREFNTP